MKHNAHVCIPRDSDTLRNQKLKVEKMKFGIISQESSRWIRSQRNDRSRQRQKMYKDNEHTIWINKHHCWRILVLFQQQ